ncbi:MAG: hypothetical protein M3O22_09225 [Pseudomonadota bacterium]|nr:hypothetical protein [Pseudomonadota bacterium]
MSSANQKIPCIIQRVQGVVLDIRGWNITDEKHYGAVIPGTLIIRATDTEIFPDTLRNHAVCSSITRVGRLGKVMHIDLPLDDVRTGLGVLAGTGCLGKDRADEMMAAANRYARMNHRIRSARDLPFLGMAATARWALYRVIDTGVGVRSQIKLREQLVRAFKDQYVLVSAPVSAAGLACPEA